MKIISIYVRIGKNYHPKTKYKHDFNDSQTRIIKAFF